MSLKRADQIALLEACLKFTETGEFPPMFSYPNCGYDLVQAGLVTEDRKITTPGRAALYLLDKGPELEPDTSVLTFTLPRKTAE